MVKPVNNEQFCIFLNSAFVNKEIEFNGDGNLVDSKTKDVLMNLEMSDIKFENNEFIVNKQENETKKVTGMNVKMIDKFAKWASKYNNTNYKLSSYNNSNSYDISSFKFPPDKHEIIYSENSNYYLLSQKIENNILYLRYSYTNYYTILNETNCSRKLHFRLMKLSEKNK